MHEEEEQLSGGNTAESVVRLGSTVRKPVTPSTPAVHNLLAYLHAAGFQASPNVFGLDQQGRQVLEYVPGPSWQSSARHTPTELRRVGAIIRSLHDTVVSFPVPDHAHWNVRYESKESELICHNDLAPWNLVCGDDRWVFIDWDAAAPSTRLWDLAWASISFPPFGPEGDPLVSGRSMYALVDGYGLEQSKYGELIKLMVTRARAEHDLIVGGAEAGEQPWLRLYAERHHHYWGPVADTIDRHSSAIEGVLLSLSDAAHQAL